MQSQLIYLILVMIAIWLLLDASTKAKQGEKGIVETFVRGFFPS